jgi:diguanylate cyclase (GGDEF)-like protein
LAGKLTGAVYDLAPEADGMNWLARAFGGIRTRMVMLGMIVALPFVVDQLRSIDGDRDAAIEAARREAERSATLGAEEIGSVFAEARTLLRTLVRTPEILQAGGTCTSELLDVRLGFDWLLGLGLAAPDGRIICSTNRLAAGHSIADRAYFKAARNSPVFALSDVLAGRFTNQLAIVGAMSAGTGPEGPGYVLTAAIDVEKVASLVADGQLLDDTEVFLLDQANDVAAQYPRRSNAKSLTPEIKAAIGTLTRAYFIATDAKGVPRVFAVHYLTNSPARLVVATSLQKPLAVAHDRAIDAYIHAAGIVAMMFVIALVAGELFLIRPMRALSEASARIAHGDLSARVKLTHASNQFRDLAAAFNFMADRVQRLAGTDTLTKIANRREFDLRLREEWSRSQRTREPLALAFIDIDHFKPLNDRLGHVAGDACLQEIGLILDDHARRPSDLAARYGGDEFALLLPGLSGDEAFAHAERMRAAIEAARIEHPGNRAGVVTVSVGVASAVPRAGETVVDFLARADEALYEAKARRNQVVLYDTRPRLAALKAS